MSGPRAHYSAGASQRHLMASALLLWASAAPALAYSANDAADCAAFNMAQWDYEVAHFSAADRSAGWKDQAAGFSKVARRMGMPQATINQVIAQKRGPMEALVTANIFTENPKQRRAYRKLDKGCARIMRKAPEMEAFR